VSTDAPGTTSFNVATEMLRRHGIQPGDYTQVTGVDDAGRSGAIVAGMAAAAILQASMAIQLQKQGYPLLATSSEVRVPFVGLAASQAALQTKRDLLKRGVQATLEAVRTVREDRAGVVSLMAREFNLTDDDAAGIYDQLRSGWSVDGRPSKEAMEFDFMIAQRDMNLSSPVTPEQVYDFSLLDEVLAGR
jgi:ABC-type nitrate/sulfonate/bicarbonate transport system substrate-binding protein